MRCSEAEFEGSVLRIQRPFAKVVIGPHVAMILTTGSIGLSFSMDEETNERPRLMRFVGMLQMLQDWN